MKLLNHYLPESNLQSENEALITRHKSSLLTAIPASGRIMIPMRSGYQCCKPEEILYLKAEDNYTEIHYADGTKKLLSKTLKSLEAILPSHRFFRVHKSYVVNAGHITDIILSTCESAVKLIGEHTIPISRDKKSIFTNSNEPFPQW